jgi:hypothetical protein
VSDQGVDRRVRRQLGSHRPALLQHRHHVTQFGHLAEPVRDPDDPDSFGSEPSYDAEQRVHLNVIQDRRRLIEDE